MSKKRKRDSDSPFKLEIVEATVLDSKRLPREQLLSMLRQLPYYLSLDMWQHIIIPYLLPEAENMCLLPTIKLPEQLPTLFRPIGGITNFSSPSREIYACYNRNKGAHNTNSERVIIVFSLSDGKFLRQIETGIEYPHDLLFTLPCEATQQLILHQWFNAEEGNSSDRLSFVDPQTGAVNYTLQVENKYYIKKMLVIESVVYIALRLNEEDGDDEYSSAVVMRKVTTSPRGIISVTDHPIAEEDNQIRWMDVDPLTQNLWCIVAGSEECGNTMKLQQWLVDDGDNTAIVKYEVMTWTLHWSQRPSNFLWNFQTSLFAATNKLQDSSEIFLLDRTTGDIHSVEFVY